MWRLTNAGDRMLVAVLDADECVWRAAIDAGITADWDPTAPTTMASTHPAAVTSGPATAVPSSRVPSPPQPVTAVADPADDPLDPRWRGRPTAAHATSDWTPSRVGER